MKAEKKINKVTGMVLRTRYLEVIYFEPFLPVFVLKLQVPFKVTRIEEMITN